MEKMRRNKHGLWNRPGCLGMDRPLRPRCFGGIAVRRSPQALVAWSGQKLSRLPQSAVEPKLGPVVVGHGPVVIVVGLRQSLDGGDYLLGPNYQKDQLATCCL